MKDRNIYCIIAEHDGCGLLGRRGGFVFESYTLGDLNAVRYRAQTTASHGGHGRVFVGHIERNNITKISGPGSSEVDPYLDNEEGMFQWVLISERDCDSVFTSNGAIVAEQYLIQKAHKVVDCVDDFIRRFSRFGPAYIARISLLEEIHPKAKKPEKTKTWSNLIYADKKKQKKKVPNNV